MQPTEGVVRGMIAIDTGGPITVPVGETLWGACSTSSASPWTTSAPVNSEKRYPIHRHAPTLDEQSTELEMFETGIKVIDLIQPFLRGGKIGLFGGAGVGKTVLIMELINNIARSTPASRSSRASASARARATTSCARWSSRRSSSSARSSTSTSRRRASST